VDSRNDIAVFNLINEALSHSFDLNELLNIILKKAIEYVPVAEAGSIYVGYEAINEFRAEACIGYDINLVNQVCEKYSDVRADFQKHREIVFCREHRNIDEFVKTQGEDRYNLHMKVMAGRTLHRSLNVRIVENSELIAILLLDVFDSKKKFTNNDIEFCRILANQAAIAIKNSKMYIDSIRKTKRIQFINQINNTISKTFDLHEIFSRILEESVRIIPAAEAGTIFVGNEATDVWGVECTVGYDIDEISKIRDSYSKIKNKYLESPFEINVRDLNTIENIVKQLGNERYQLHIKLLDGRILERSMIIPLVHDGILIGTLTLDCFDKNMLFTKDDIEYMSTIADQSIIAINNAKIFQKERTARIALDKRINELLIVNAISNAVNGSYSMNDLLTITYNKIYENFKINTMTIALIDMKNKMIDILVNYENGVNLGRSSQGIFQGILSKVIQNKEPLLINDVEKELQGLDVNPHVITGNHEYITRSWFGVPLYIGKTIIGILKVESDMAYAFTNETCNVLKIVANQIAVALNNQKMMDDITESKIQEEKLRKTFQRFVPEDVINELVIREESDLFKGYQEKAVILFTDLRNFTAMVEKYAAKTIVKMLNSYFTLMVDAVIANGGIIDKFIGDSMMAIFRANSEGVLQMEAVYDVVRNMQQKLTEFNKKNEEQQLPHFHMGIGLHYGDVIIGNIGSPQKMDYTVIGDAVNVASRLESLCKYFDVECIASEEVALKINKNGKVRELGYITVKGKTIPLKIYEIMNEKSVFYQKKKMLQIYEKAIYHYKLRQWNLAIELFSRILEFIPQEKSSLLHIESCYTFKRYPPGLEWQGEIVFDTN
jgi:class 3 adenylate cyclase/putative methionine-R-sulfoxide reductase with GAF domain